MRHFALAALLLSTSAFGGTFSEEADFIGESDPLDPTEEIDLGMGDHIAFGDFCGDGNLDMVVSTDQAEGKTYLPSTDWHRQTGRVGVFYDVGDLNSSYEMANADVIVEGENKGDHFGSSLNVSDIDGDGQDDLIVGARIAETYDCADTTTCSSAAGAVYVIYGTRICEHQRSVKNYYDIKFMEESRPNEGIGNAVTSGFDFDTDGYEDIVIGAYSSNYVGESDPVNWGAIYAVKNVSSMSKTSTGGDGIVFLNDFGTNDDIAKFTGEDNGHKFGHLTENVGDMDGDTYDDLVISSWCAVNYKQGTVYGLYGIGSAEFLSATVNDIVATADFIIDGVNDDYFGEVLSGTGTFQDNGTPGLLVGAGRTDEGGSDRGAAFIFYGPLTGIMDSTDADVEIWGDDNSGFLGSMVGGAGGGGIHSDFDLYENTMTTNLFHDDILIGGGRVDGSGIELGMICVIPGGQGLSGTYLVSDTALNAVCIEGDTNYNRIGLKDAYRGIMGAIGDINADGYADWATGIPGLENPDGAHTGGAKLFLGEDR